MFFQGTNGHVHDGYLQGADLIHFMNINRRVLVVVAVVALILNFGVAFALGLNRPMESDSFYFLCIAKSLAAGHGYMLTEGFWPDVPTMSRAPGWPLVVSLALRVAPGVNPDVVMRLLACCLNAVAAVLVAQLAWMLTRRGIFEQKITKNTKKSSVCSAGGGNKHFSFVNFEGFCSKFLNLRRVVATLAGCIYAAYPIALYEAYESTSEILFIVLALTGSLLIISGQQAKFVAAPAKAWIFDSVALTRVNHRLPAAATRIFLGFFIMGCAVLVRPNFITWIGFVGILVMGYSLFGNGKENIGESHIFTPTNNKQPIPNNSLLSRSTVYCLLFATLFLLPPTLWAIRNYHVCGKFPVLSTLRGQTFYGGNNSVVSDSFKWWGYWVFPNSIPGEPTMYSLSRTMTEQQVDDYYFTRGKDWIRSHKLEMPRLIVGKLVRAYVPIPWKISAKSVLVAGCRWMLYVASLAGLLMAWRAMSPALKVVLICMALSNLLTVVIFWGCARFAFELDPFLIPFAALAVAHLLKSYRQSGVGRMSPSASVAGEEQGGWGHPPHTMSEHILLT